MRRYMSQQRWGNRGVVARFSAGAAQLMGLYHEKEKSVTGFVDANGVPMLLRRVEWLSVFFRWIMWPGLRALAEGHGGIVAIKEMQGVTGKEIWITGPWIRLPARPLRTAVGKCRISIRNKS